MWPPSHHLSACDARHAADPADAVEATRHVEVVLRSGQGRHERPSRVPAAVVRGGGERTAAAVVDDGAVGGVQCTDAVCGDAGLGVDATADAALGEQQCRPVRKKSIDVLQVTPVGAGLRVAPVLACRACSRCERGESREKERREHGKSSCLGDSAPDHLCHLPPKDPGGG